MSSIFYSDCPMLIVARFAKAEELARKEVCSHPFFHPLHRFYQARHLVISDLNLLNRGKNGKSERYCLFSCLSARTK
jgi:hypothetical protein